MSNEPVSRKTRQAIKGAAHDLGNLAYRLTFLTESLRAQIPEAGPRADAIELLEDTTSKLTAIIEKLSEVEKDG